MRYLALLFLLLLSSSSNLWSNNSPYPKSTTTLIKDNLEPNCADPVGLSLVQATHNSLHVTWSAGAGTINSETKYFHVAITTRDKPKSNVLQNPTLVQGTTQFTFTNLSPNTAYYVYIRAVCKVQIGDAPEFIEGDWVKVTFFTTGMAISDCFSDTTSFQITNINFNGFSIGMSPMRDLRYNGRRLLVRYRLLSDPVSFGMAQQAASWQERLLYDENDLRIEGLFQTGSYEVYIKQLRDGSYNNYVRACPEVGPLIVNMPYFETECSILKSVTVPCAGAGYINLKFDAPPEGINGVRYLVALKPQNSGTQNWQFFYHFEGESMEIDGLIASAYEIRIFPMVGGSRFNYDFLCIPYDVGIVSLSNTSLPDIDGDGIPNGCDSNDNDGPLGDLDFDGIPNQDETEVVVNPYPEMPELNCDDKVGPTITNDKLIANINEGQIIFINGLPILLTMVKVISEGHFNGEGIIGLPFKSKYLKVEFNDVTVNTDHQIIDGKVLGISENLGNYPNLALDTIIIGEDRFCKPVPVEEGFDENGVWVATGNNYNPLGFNQAGHYVMPPYDGSQSGLPYDPKYDPNGFGSDGNYLNTGSPYNPAGCNQLGFNAQNQTCDNNPSQTPYYWMNNNNANGPVTEAGLELANALIDTLRPLILAKLSVLEIQYKDSLQLTKINCNLVRDTMKTHFDALGYTNTRDRAFIFGSDDDWLEEGMSRKFKEVPKPLGIVLDRDPNEERLELSHISLYHCDVKLIRQQGILDILEAYGDEPAITEMVQTISGMIKRLPSAQAIQYANFNLLKEWIGNQLDSLARAEYNFQNGITFSDEINVDDPTRWVAKSKKHQNRTGLLADNGASIDPELLHQATDISWSDIAFEYGQGFETVNGIDRAFFLEAIDKARTIEGNSLLVNGNEASFMPLIMKKDVLGRTYTLMMDNLEFTPTGGTADIFIIINATPSPNRLIFKAFNVPFGPGGFTGETKLALGTTLEIPISNPVRLSIIGNENTYVTFDCDGFKGMSVEADVEFCRKYVVPLNPTTLKVIPDEDKMVKGHFIAAMPAWGEFVVDINIDPFAITQYDSIKWIANGIVFDFSSSLTPATVKFPNNYVSPFVVNQNGTMVGSPQWRGFYMKTMTVVLPNQFSKNNGQTISVGAQNLIFDDTGLSGRVFASPILDICDGNMGGWAFSIDTFAVQAVNNKLKGFEINGKLNIPLFASDNANCPADSSCLRYKATIMPGNLYSFSLSPIDTSYTVKMWKGKVVLYNNSEVTMTVKDGKFLLEANLTGRLTINGQLSSNFATKIKDIGFENVVIRNKAPYFDPGKWSVPSISAGLGFGGFGIFVKNTEMIKIDSTRGALSFGAGIIVLDKQSNYVVVDGGFRLKGKLEIINKRQRWVYDGFSVDSVTIDASFPGVDRVYGSLHFFGQDAPHPTYGKGFRGEVKVDFAVLDVSLSAVGVFGRMGGSDTINEYRYFMIDALAEFNPGINMGALQLLGFGGGASYHMERIGSMETGLPTDIINQDPSILTLGKSLSGIIYIPNKVYGLSLHATVVLSLPKKEAFNVNATFGISFYENWGLHEVFFKGTGKFMDDIDFSAIPLFVENGVPSADAAITAFVYITYEFAPKRLTGTFSVHIHTTPNILIGSGLVEMLFEPGRWYVNIGRPDQPIYVDLKIPGVNIGLGQVAFYFDIGKDIPAFPGLPANVAELTGLGNIVANESLRRTGSGFATGLRFELNTGDLNFLIFYAKFNAGVGFDLMMQDYGNATCANLGGSKLGINGWYASGQMWAFISGAVGINVRLWGDDKKFEILNLAAAAALQTKFPSPFYARGVVGGRYRILGGLVKGDCRFDFEMGQQCDIAGGNNPSATQKVIYELLPADSLTGINTLSIPKVTFNVPIGQDLNDGTDIWRASVESTEVYADGLILGTQKSYTSGGTVLEIKTYNMLPANKWIRVKVKVKLTKNGQFNKYEEEEVSFQTQGAPDIIPSSNVELAYPFDRQYNFYKNEYSAGKGHIILKFGQPELLQNPPTGYTRTMRLTNVATNATNEFPFTYEASNRKIVFDLPESFLEANKVYRLEIRNKAVAGSLVPPPTGDEYGASVPTVPPSIYTMHFRVSQYNRFADKVEALKTNVAVSNYSTNWLRAQSTLSEPFDYYEVYGDDSGNSLVNSTLNLEASNWFTTNKNYLKVAYNYFQTNSTLGCYTTSFTNAPNVFDQQNFAALESGFEEPPSNPKLQLTATGAVPSYSGTLVQYIDFTAINSFSPMWGDTKADLNSYKSFRCTGSSWGGVISGCTGLTPLCPPTSSSCSSCTMTNALEGNPILIHIAEKDFPPALSGSKFPVTLKYNVPGHGVTTVKVLDIIKP